MSVSDEPASVEQHDAVAEARHNPEVMADEDHGMPGRPQLSVPLFAACLESRIPDGEDLVEHQHLADRGKCHRIREARCHAARVVLQLQLGKPLQFGKGQNLVELPPDDAERQAED